MCKLLDAILFNILLPPFPSYFIHETLSPSHVCRLLNAMCEHQQNRGVMVQQGATKALLQLSLEGNSKGKECAAQALARITITINPEVAFPGQRVSR